MTKYDKDRRVHQERGGYTVDHHGRRFRVLPYEGGHRWGAFVAASPLATILLNLHPDEYGYRTADEAIASLIGDPQ